MPQRKNHKIKRWLYLVIILLLFYCFVEPFWIDVNRLNFQSADLPKSFNNKTIVFVSDIHCGPYFSVNRVKQLVKIINYLKPDWVMLGGDYIQFGKNYIDVCLNPLKDLRPSFKVYAVLGNHDNWSDPEKIKNQIQAAHIELLDNKADWVNLDSERIKIGGVGDLWTEKPSYQEITQDAKINDFIILLSHNPDYFQKIPLSELEKIDLVLAGHTHGGQVSFFNLWTPVIHSQYGYTRGFYHKNNSTLFITRGIGTVTLPIRLFTRPEIVFITLKSF